MVTHQDPPMHSSKLSGKRPDNGLKVQRSQAPATSANYEELAWVRGCVMASHPAEAS